MKLARSLSFLASLTLAGAAHAQSGPQLQQIDPEAIAAKLARGKFVATTEEIAADGKKTVKTEPMCMNEMAANMLPLGVMMGLAGCEPLSSKLEGESFAVAGSCPKDTAGPSFYKGSMRWSGDGKIVETESVRYAMVDGKPAAQVRKSVTAKLTFEGGACK